MKTFREIAIEESKDNFWHLTYRGKSEGYFVIKAKTKEDAEKYFEEEKHELFKNASGIYVDNIEKAEKYEEEYVINESDWENEKKKVITELNKKGFNITSVPAIGTFGKKFNITIVAEYKNKKDANNVDIKKITTVLNKIFTKIKLDTGSKDYSGGKEIQSVDWRKEGPNDPHEVYLEFTGEL